MVVGDQQTSSCEVSPCRSPSQRSSSEKPTSKASSKARARSTSALPFSKPTKTSTVKHTWVASSPSSSKRANSFQTSPRSTSKSFLNIFSKTRANSPTQSIICNTSSKGSRSTPASPLRRRKRHQHSYGSFSLKPRYDFIQSVSEQLFFVCPFLTDLIVEQQRKVFVLLSILWVLFYPLHHLPFARPGWRHLPTSTQPPNSLAAIARLALLAALPDQEDMLYIIGCIVVAVGRLSM